MTDFEKKIEEFAVDLYKIKGVKFGQYVLKSGITSPVYFDLRVIVSHPKLMVTLAELLVELLESKNVIPKTICGVPYTALPIATLVSTSTNIPMVVRRKEQKAYGTGKMVEGEFNAGDTCVIIEDVISTGSSILETAKDLSDTGLIVTDAAVVLDREHGAAEYLEGRGIKPHVLISLTQLLTILYCRGYITQQVVADVKRFVSQSQVNVNGSMSQAIPTNPRTSQTFQARAEAATNPVAKKLLSLIASKQSLLCVAADVTSSAELIKVAGEVGPYIAVLKTHADAVTDFTTSTADQLVELARVHNFMIMEDRKFADIGNTVRLQYSAMRTWAELVTAHSLAGPSVLEGLVKGAHGRPLGVFLLAELSSKGALTESAYAKETIKMAEATQEVVVGVVCQTRDLLMSPGLVQLTPGVRLSQEGDGLGQQYVDCDTAVIKKGADLAVVGRGIIEASSRADAAQSYKSHLWQAYLQRING